MNKIIITGRLTKDPELKQTPNGVSVCNLSVAVNRRFKKDEADFFNVQAWRQTAEFISKYFHKGEPILIEGSMQMRNYEDKTGAKRTAWELIADNVEFFGGKSEGGTSPTSAPIPTAEFTEVEDDNDLPI